SMMMAGAASTPATETELIVSGESWLQRPGPSGEDVFINYAGRSLSYRSENSRGATSIGVTIGWPVAPWAAPYNLRLVLHRGGTIWYPESATYLREHAAAATLAAKAKINGIDAEVIEWQVPAADAALAFANSVTTDGLLAGGGTCRAAVSPS